MRTLLLSACLAAPLLGAATAQDATAQERLPTTSRSEQQYNAINRSLREQQQGLGVSQQNQFETNQLRGEIQRGNQAPLIIGPGSGRGCPAGSIGC